MTAAAEIASHVALSDGFSLLVVVCQGHDQRDELLRNTLDAIGPGAAIWVSPREAEDWPSLLLGDIERASLQRADLLVIDASEAHPLEDAGWVRVLRRLNEGRDRIAAHFRGAVALAIPPWLFQILPYEAPDLWSVRSAVARGEAKERPVVSFLASGWRIRRLERRIVPRLKLSRSFYEYQLRVMDMVGSQGEGALSVLDALRPSLSKNDPDALAAAQLLFILAYGELSQSRKESASILRQEALGVFRRINESAPVDLQMQILRVQLVFAGLLAQEDEIGDLEDALRSLKQSPLRFGALFADGALWLSLRDQNRERSFALMRETFDLLKHAEKQEKDWASQRMPDVLWLLAAHFDGFSGRRRTKELRTEAIARVRSLAERDPAVRSDLPLWLAEAAALEEDPTERLRGLLEALALSFEPPSPEISELREVFPLPFSALPEPLRSRAVHEIDALSARIGAEHPLSGLLGDVKRGLCGEHPEQPAPP